MEDNIRITDTDKLRKLGFQDGYERAVKILQREPENIQYLDSVSIPEYQEAYREGIEAAKQQFGYQSEVTENPKVK